MSKTISQAIQSAAVGAARGEPAPDPQKTVKGLFMLFHGWYGNLFLSRFESGDKDKAGKDRGTLSAMAIWQSALGRFDGDVVREAADRCQVEHPKYPPTLPEFVAICRAAQPREAYSGPMKVEMSEGLKSSYTARARAEAMARYRANRAGRDVGSDAVRDDDGLFALQLLVAHAVGLAGGDEVAVLRRFDRAAAGRAGQGV